MKNFKLFLTLLMVAVLGCGQMWGATYVKVTSASDLVAGQVYVIAEISENTKYLVTGTGTKLANTTLGFTVSNNTITTSTATPLEFTLGTVKSGNNTYYTLKCSSTNYLGYSSSTNFRTSETTTTDTKEQWSITSTNSFDIRNVSTLSANTKRRIARNSASIGPYDASNSSYKPCYLFKKQASCTNSVTINKGTATNCTFTLTPNGQQESCDGVTTTVSITPTTGYGNPSVTQSGASKTPTISGTGNTRTITYQANTTGTSTVNVSCSANTYTITLNKDLTPTTAGTASITATYNSSNNLTSAITKPTATGWTFGGYYTAKNGGGTLIIDADGNVKANVSNYTDSNKKWIKADNVTLYAKWTRTVTWSVNNNTTVYSAQTVTYNATSSKVASVPSPNPNDYCGDKFVGWTTEENVSQDDDTGLNLFTTVAGSPDLNSITTDVTFYAVFADYAQQ